MKCMGTWLKEGPGSAIQPKQDLPEGSGRGLT